MYSWGDDTKTWKNPGAYDFGSAKAPYLKKLEDEAASKGSRTYTSKKKEPKLELVNPKGKVITSQSTNPIVIAVDGTGSMASWPAEIFDRLPLLYQTLSKYREDTELSFSVIGDARCDSWPLQVADFGKGTSLDEHLKALLAEGGGGGGMRESYELFAYFMAKHCTTPKATSPFMIIMGDEMFYETIDPLQVSKLVGDELKQGLDSKELWKELGQKFDIYLLRKSYAGYDDKIEAQWKEAIGSQKIIPVYDPLRVVDVAMGIIAKHWGEFGDFKKSMAARQDSKNIDKVVASLKYVSEAKLEPGMKSKVKNGSAKKSMALGGE